MSQDKEIYFIRHGLTQMNQYMYDYYQKQMSLRQSDFKDPMFYDTVLNDIGQSQALSIADITKDLDPQPEVILVSPLTRTLQTCEAAFCKSLHIPREIEPELRERVYYSSDLGSNPEQLKQQWPKYDFSKLDQIWWYNNKNPDPKWVISEPMNIFAQRVHKFKDILQNRPEKVIACVTHHGLLYELTGKGFNNCEISKFPLSQLMQRKPTQKA